MNPLEAIGLSSRIKELPLSQDHLYECVQKFRKAIVFCVHPDRGGSHEDYVKVGKAIEALGTRERFDQALKGLNGEANTFEMRKPLSEIAQLQDRIRWLEAEKSVLWERFKQSTSWESQIKKLQAENEALKRELKQNKSNHNPLKNDKLLKIAEVARRLKVTQDWLYRHWEEYPFAVKLSPKQLRFSEKGLEEYIQQHQP